MPLTHKSTRPAVLSRRRQLRVAEIVILLAATLGLTFSLHAQPSARAAIDTEAVCAAAGKTPILETLLPTEAEFIRQTTCSPMDLYYREGTSHFSQARLCAMSKREARQAENNSTDSEAALVLAMLFSNGEGVARNPALAERFACEDNDAGTDMQAILGAIQSGKKLDICHGDVSAGRSPTYYCVQMAQSRVNLALETENVQAKKKLSPAVWAAWGELDRARQAYAAAHDEEVPVGTSGNAVFNMTNREEADEQWLGYLKAIESGVVPEGVLQAGEYKVADEALNSAYKDRISMGEENGGCRYAGACPEALRTAERAWLRYRDAWVKLGAARWPRIPADKWRSWVTAARASELGDL